MHMPSRYKGICSSFPFFLISLFSVRVTAPFFRYVILFLALVNISSVIHARNADKRLAHLLSFQLLVGAKYTTGWVPTELKEATFQALHAHCDVLKDYYDHNGDSYVLKASR